MQAIYDWLNEWAVTLTGETWRWFAGLTREEWLIVLAAVTAIGFLCMRGYGSLREPSPSVRHRPA